MNNFTHATIKKMVKVAGLVIFLSSCSSATYSEQNYTVEQTIEETEVIFAIGLSPGEGIPKFKAKRTIRPLQKPDKNSDSVIGIEIQAGEEIQSIETIFKTLKSAPIAIEEDTVLPNVMNYGEVQYLSREDYYSSGELTNLQLKKGDVINVLQPRAEGTVFFEYQSDIYSGICSPCYNSAPSQTAWWIKIDKADKTGWVLINDSNVELIERQF